MPKKLKSNISGTELLKFFKSQNFTLKRTKGSHMVLIRKMFLQKQVLIIPNHKVISKGTSKAIYRQAMQFIPESELFNEFYSK